MYRIALLFKFNIWNNQINVKEKAVMQTKPWNIGRLLSWISHLSYPFKQHETGSSNSQWKNKAIVLAGQ